MAHCATELFERYIFTGDGFYNVWTSNEHVACFAHHEDEVGHCWRIHSTTGAWAKDDRNLWNNTRRQNVAIENAAVAGK